MKKIAAAGLFLFSASHGMAAECKDSAVKAITRISITAAGGQVYFLGPDFLDPKGWKVGDQLSICPSPQDHFFYIQDVGVGDSVVAADRKPAPR